MGVDDGVLAREKKRAIILMAPRRGSGLKMQIHPSDILLRKTFQDPTSCCDGLIDHIDRCMRCRKRLRVLLIPSLGAKPFDYDSAFDRSFQILQSAQRAFVRERAEAPGLLSALRSHPIERQKILLRNHPRFQTWGLLEILLRRSHDEIFHGAGNSSDELAHLGLMLADYLDSALYGSERIEDLRARAWGLIGNSRRVSGHLPEADQAFAQAFCHLRTGTGDVIEQANLLQLKASLRRLQRRFTESLRLLERTIAIFRKVGEHHSVGRSLVKLAVLHHVQGESEKGIPLLKMALPLLDPLDSRVVVCAWHNLVDDMATTGRFMEAQGFLAKARAIYQQFPEPEVQGRLKWVEGKISRGLGRYREARTLLQSAHNGLQAANLPHEAAQVSSEILSLPL